jgi:hypothetical protein
MVIIDHTVGSIYLLHVRYSTVLYLVVLLHLHTAVNGSSS